MSVYHIDNTVEPSLAVDLDIGNKDASLNGNCEGSLSNEYKLNLADFNRLFFSEYGIEYISHYFFSKGLNLRVVSHPHETNTCFQKADMLSPWDPINIIKAFYLECSTNNSLYVIVVPETGCFIDKVRIKDTLNIPPDGFVKKASTLPANMSFGTCSPFIVDNDLLANDGKVKKIIFDTETLVIKKKDNSLDDFSFGLDHRMSLQMNYYHCFRMLKRKYPNTVVDEEILNLSFKENFVRNKGKIKISYQFNSLNYRTAKFINSIHGYGDVSIINDCVDELDLPDVLTDGAK